jgi:hypothetical protein
MFYKKISPIEPTTNQEDRQCTYNIISRRVHESLLRWEIKKYYLSVRACVSVRACGYPGAWACACAHVHVALLIQHAKRMRHIVTSFVAPRSPLYFSTLSHKRCDFLKKILNIKCVLFFFLQFCLKHYPFLE